jgi:heat shock protein HtpX
MWDQIRSNKRRSALLLSVMFLLMMTLGLFLGVLLQSVLTDGKDAEMGDGWIFLGILIGSLAFMGEYAIYAFAPQSVLFSGLKVRQIQKEDFPTLYNVVEEMSIAAGLSKVPSVYMIFDPSPNAFAFGKGDDASVAVTTGLVKLMTRDELQGVIGHEIGHIRNRDIEFMTLAAVMLGAIVVLSDLAARIIVLGGAAVDSGSSDGDDDNRGGSSGLQIFVVVVGLIVMIVGPALAQLLYFASSRRREYLADASSAIFTRYPEGLASALEKLADPPVQMAKVNRAVAPLFIVNPIKNLNADDLLATHPPLEKRIAVLRRMGGASLAEYNRAAATVLGRPVLRKQEGEDAADVPIRPPLPKDAASMFAAVAAATGATPGASGEAQTASAADQSTPPPSPSASDVQRALSGYRLVRCTCGLQIKVPPNLRTDTLQCPRCGEHLTLPPEGAGVTLTDETPISAGSTSEAQQTTTQKADLEAQQTAAEKADLEAQLTPAQKAELEAAGQPYIVRKPGRWQKCTCPVCAQKIQLSPAFSMEKMRCPKCRTWIKIVAVENKEEAPSSA